MILFYLTDFLGGNFSAFGTASSEAGLKTFEVGMVY